jgi:type I restriction enzyme R subunit
MANVPNTNFGFFQGHSEQMLRLGMLAEKYFADDPNTCLLKLRQFSELLAQMTASQVGLYTSPEESQYDLLRRLQDQAIVPLEVAQLFNEARRAGNAAARFGQDLKAQHNDEVRINRFSTNRR